MQALTEGLTNAWVGSAVYNMQDAHKKGNTCKPRVRYGVAGLFSLLWLLLAALPATALDDTDATATLGALVSAPAATLFGGAKADFVADLTTPRGSVENLIQSSRAGDYKQAAKSLDFTGLAPQERVEAGPDLARRLKFILDNRFVIAWDALPDAADGTFLDVEAEPAAEGAPTPSKVTVHTAEDNRPRREVLLGSITFDGREVPIRMRRLDVEGERRWLFTRDTISAIDPIYRSLGMTTLTEYLPERLQSSTFVGISVSQWLFLLLFAILSYLLALLVRGILMRLLPRLDNRRRQQWRERLSRDADGPLLAVGFFVLMHVLSVGLLGLTRQSTPVFYGLLAAALVLSCTWMLGRLIHLGAEIYVAEFTDHIREHDPLRARSIETQSVVLRKLLNTVVVIVGVGIAASQFQGFRNLGTSLLASAGIAGIVIGLAAQRPLGNLFAGIQLAITQPVRIGDSVIFEGDFGTIEDITYTYLVIQTWDLRRVVVPITYLLDKPIQNWTRNSTAILGTVELYVDFACPLDPLREQLKKIVTGHPKWDGELAIIQVTEVKEQSMLARILIGAPDAAAVWDLRCEIREKLMVFLQQYEGGRFLPRRRVESDKGPVGQQPEHTMDEIAERHTDDGGIPLLKVKKPAQNE